MVTGIGSFPFTDVDEAIDLIFSTCREIPFWPQLPKRSRLENMYTPFLGGVPCVVFDETKDSTFLDTGKTEGIEEFYENYFHGNLEAFQISKELAPGFYRFLERIPEIRDAVKFIKCQLTGPFSMGLGLKDEHGKSIIYHNSFFDIVKKQLSLNGSFFF